MTTRSGYYVVIKGFIPTDPADLDGLAEVLASIREARTPFGEVNTDGAERMFDLMEMELFEVRPVSRRAKAEGEAS